MRRYRHNSRLEVYWRNVTFGVEDGLVSTVGLLSGVATAGVAQKSIIVTGVILIFVEAFSMGVGSLLTEHSVEEYEQHSEVPMSRALFGGVVMFFSYLTAGLVPLLPYLFLEVNTALVISIFASIAALGLLGTISARKFKINLVHHVIEMMLLGGIAIGVGVAVAIFLPH